MTRLLCLLLLAGHAQAGDFWSDLWTTADQRGDRLLRQGQAAAAAKTYADPRRRAHAELLAGDYAAAARDYATYDDADAHYNRGIALAHLGRLPEALQAFDAALARAPGDRDARHNRDLVARQITSPPAVGGPGERERPAPERGRDSLTSALAQGERGQAKPMDRTAADISREQWLRQIPDDPGGLLRRKFMIEHTLRQNRR